MKATEANSIANEMFKSKYCNNHPYEVIVDLIKKNAEKGKYFVGVTGSLSSDVSIKLISDGFHVEFIKSNFNTLISWDKIETK